MLLKALAKPTTKKAATAAAADPLRPRAEEQEEGEGEGEGEEAGGKREFPAPSVTAVWPSGSKRHHLARAVEACPGRPGA